MLVMALVSMVYLYENPQVLQGQLGSPGMGGTPCANDDDCGSGEFCSGGHCSPGGETGTVPGPGTGGGPICDPPCTAGLECVGMAGSPGQCEPIGGGPCENAASPACNGTCPQGQTCTDNAGAGCICMMGGGECGDGEVNGGETCDSGRDSGGNEVDCRPAGGEDECTFCGDNVRQADELCDDGPGNGTPGSICTTSCTTDPTGGAECGNGEVEDGETCDGEPGCRPAGDPNECTMCGDRVVQAAAGEECDEGTETNETPNSGCSTTCRNEPRSCNFAVPTACTPDVACPDTQVCEYIGGGCGCTCPDGSDPPPGGVCPTMCEDAAKDECSEGKCEEAHLTCKVSGEACGCMCKKDDEIMIKKKCLSFTCPEPPNPDKIEIACREQCEDEFPAADAAYQQHCILACICECEEGGAPDPGNQCYEQCILNTGPAANCADSSVEECLDGGWMGDYPSEEACINAETTYAEATCCRGQCVRNHCNPQPPPGPGPGGGNGGCIPPICPVGTTQYCEDGTIQSVTSYRVNLACQCEAVILHVNPNCGSSGPGPGGGPGPGPGPGESGCSEDSDCDSGCCLDDACASVQCPEGTVQKGCNCEEDGGPGPGPGPGGGPGPGPGAEPECGDGQKDSGEECDDGNNEDKDACSNSCVASRCGDGIVQKYDPNAPIPNPGGRSNGGSNGGGSDDGGSGQNGGNGPASNNGGGGGNNNGGGGGGNECDNDNDCRARGANHCQNGKCQGEFRCDNDGECKAAGWKRCSNGQCVDCRNNNECTYTCQTGASGYGGGANYRCRSSYCSADTKTFDGDCNLSGKIALCRAAGGTCITIREGFDDLICPTTGKTCIGSGAADCPIPCTLKEGGAIAMTPAKSNSLLASIFGPSADGSDWEQCDDGNLNNGDGCSANCQIEEEEDDEGGSGPGPGAGPGVSSSSPSSRCGDGVRNPEEGCDDGNTQSGDGCSKDCVIEEFCGDGVLQEAGSQCTQKDDGISTGQGDDPQQEEDDEQEQQQVTECEVETTCEPIYNFEDLKRFPEDDVIEVQEDGLDGMEQITLSACIKPSKGTIISKATVITESSRSVCDEAFSYDFGITSFKDEPFMRIGCTLRGFQKPFQQGLTDWYHLAGVYDGDLDKVDDEGFTQSTMYADGLPLALESRTAHNNTEVSRTNWPLRIGAKGFLKPDGSQVITDPFGDSIMHARVYDCALPANEIRELAACCPADEQAVQRKYRSFWAQLLGNDPFEQEEDDCAEECDNGRVCSQNPSLACLFDTDCRKCYNVGGVGRCGGDENGAICTDDYGCVNEKQYTCEWDEEADDTCTDQCQQVHTSPPESSSSSSEESSDEFFSSAIASSEEESSEDEEQLYCCFSGQCLPFDSCQNPLPVLECIESCAAVSSSEESSEPEEEESSSSSTPIIIVESSSSLRLVLSVASEDSSEPDEDEDDEDDDDDEEITSSVASLPDIPRCGDGDVEGKEMCDDGNTRSGDGCSEICRIEKGGPPLGQPPRCGDGLLQSAEQCDDRNTRSGDGCSKRCRLEQGNPPACGDGILTSGEECDDGNANGGDGCSVQCRVETNLVAAGPVCGNGVLDDPEECDDRNRRDDDGCSSTCLLEIGVCGDGIVQSLLGEQCESSLHNINLAYQCQNCRFLSATCGDGTVDPGEECDKGRSNSTSADASCRPDCSLARCGDGIVDSSELCDDGNRVSGDGCDRFCISEVEEIEIPEEEEETLVAAEVTTSQPVAPAFPTQYPQYPNMQQFGFPQYPNFQQVPMQLPLAQLQPLIQTQAPIGDTGPAAVAIIGAGAAAGMGWVRRRKK